MPNDVRVHFRDTPRLTRIFSRQSDHANAFSSAAAHARTCTLRCWHRIPRNVGRKSDFLLIDMFTYVAWHDLLMNEINLSDCEMCPRYRMARAKQTSLMREMSGNKNGEKFIQLLVARRNYRDLVRHVNGKCAACRTHAHAPTPTCTLCVMIGVCHVNERCDVSFHVAYILRIFY